MRKKSRGLEILKIANMVPNDSSSLTNSSYNKAGECNKYTNTELTSMYFVFSYLDLILMIISVIVLAVGLICIYSCNKKHNQNIILAGLTSSEMF